MGINRITDNKIPTPVFILNVGCCRCGKRLLRADDDGRQYAMNDATYIQLDHGCGAYCGECYLWFLSTLGAGFQVNCDDC